MPQSPQTIRYTTTRDGVRLAWALSGNGPPLVKTSNWITHLEYDWESPVWRQWVQFFSAHFSFYRYDPRGCGLSQREADDVSSLRWLPDLEDLIAAARPPTPFVLLGVSQGACPAVAYAARHPDKVSKLILYGGYAKGWAHRGIPEHIREANALIEFTEIGWGRADPLYRRLFTKRFLPDATEDQNLWFDELCAKTVSASMAGRLIRESGYADVRPLLSQVRVPTLVVHARDDRVVPLAEGQELAAGIPGAEFVQVDSKNHILLEHEPAWQRFTEAVLDFTGAATSTGGEALACLSPREREILARLTGGMTNAEIGKSLFISEKTVRNQLTKIFEKLDVANRTQAIVFARDHGFGGA